VITRALSIPELTARSDVIVLGTVSFITSDWNLNRTAIETRIDLKVFKNNRERLQVVGFSQGKFLVERRPEGLMAVRRIPGLSKSLDEFPLDTFKRQVQEAIT